MVHGLLEPCGVGPVGPRIGSQVVLEKASAASLVQLVMGLFKKKEPL